jgi:Type IV secretion system pilin
MTNILQFVIEIGSIIVVLMLVYVGYLFVIAQGNPSKLASARSALLWTVIGALILLGAQAIAMGIQATVTALGG